MGHVRNYSIGDAIARYKRQRGFHVTHPMVGTALVCQPAGCDDRGIHPKSWTYDNIAHMRETTASWFFVCVGSRVRDL